MTYIGFILSVMKYQSTLNRNLCIFFWKAFSMLSPLFFWLGVVPTWQSADDPPLHLNHRNSSGWVNHNSVVVGLEPNGSLKEAKMLHGTVESNGYPSVQVIIYEQIQYRLYIFRFGSKDSYHVITGVVHVVHMIFEEMTSRQKICTHRLPRTKRTSRWVH